MTYSQSPKKKTSPAAIVVLVLIVIFALVFILPSIIGGYNKASSTAAAVSQLSTESKGDYMKSCSIIKYNDIARNPDTYKGRPTKFTGKVIQVMENDNNVALRVNVNKVGSTYTDTIYVDYIRPAGESRILENDIITVYGDSNGIKQYETVIKTQESIPWIKAHYIILNK